jgi:hypothetical protein
MASGKRGGAVVSGPNCPGPHPGHLPEREAEQPMTRGNDIEATMEHKERKSKCGDRTNAQPTRIPFHVPPATRSTGCPDPRRPAMRGRTGHGSLLLFLQNSIKACHFVPRMRFSRGKHGVARRLDSAILCQNHDKPCQTGAILCPACHHPTGYATGPHSAPPAPMQKYSFRSAEMFTPKRTAHGMCLLL